MLEGKSYGCKKKRMSGENLIFGQTIPLNLQKHMLFYLIRKHTKDVSIISCDKLP